MARGLHLNGSENHEPPAHLIKPDMSGGIEPAYTAETRILAGLPGFEWFDAKRDHAWMMWGHNHRSTFPQFPHGMFTLRCEKDPGSRSTTILQDMAAGKMRGVFLFSDYKLPNEDKERPLFLFWVDLLIAARLAESMKPRQNSKGGLFWLFDWNDPATRSCARRFEL